MNTNANARYSATIEDNKTAPKTALKLPLAERIGAWVDRLFSRKAKDEAPAVGVAARTKRAGRTLRSRTAAATPAPEKKPSKLRQAAAKVVSAFKRAYRATMTFLFKIGGYVDRAITYTMPGLESFYRMVVPSVAAALWITALITAPFTTLAYTVGAIAAVFGYLVVAAILFVSGNRTAVSVMWAMFKTLNVALTIASVALFIGYVTVVALAGPAFLLVAGACVWLLAESNAEAVEAAAPVAAIDHGAYASIAATA